MTSEVAKVVEEKRKGISQQLRVELQTVNLLFLGSGGEKG